MHPSILGAGLLGGAVAAAAAACPPAEAPVQERFIAADCAGCWSAPADAAAVPGRPRLGWRLDWITPAGTDAALAAAALPEAAARAGRAATADRARPAGPGAPRQATAADPGRRSGGGRLAVRSGPAWHGYVGLELRWQPGRRPLPDGSTGWLALVEQLPAGSEGAPDARTLVRGVAGPLPLDAPGAVSHLHALRWPDGARPERLRARGWIEAADGRLLAMAADRCTD